MRSELLSKTGKFYGEYRIFKNTGKQNTAALIIIKCTLPVKKKKKFYYYSSALLVVGHF
jgi:ribosomal protein L30E